MPLVPTRALAALAVLASLQLALAGCGGVGRTVEVTPSAAPMPSPTTSGPSTSSATVSKVLVVVEENRSVADVEAHMPYFVSQSRRYGTATDYHANQHPSLANYLVMTGGSIFGIADDKDPAAHPLTGPSVFTQMLNAGRTAKTYAEAMPDTCVLENSGTYAVRHNPWTYFADPSERAACRKLDRPLGTPTAGELHDDVASGQLPNLGFAIPDICNDGHDCPAGTADDWLRTWLPIIEQGPDFRSGELAVVVTWDEDDGTDGNHIPLAVLHRSLQGARVSTPLDHHALSASLSRLSGATPSETQKERRISWPPSRSHPPVEALPAAEQVADGWARAVLACRPGSRPAKPFPARCRSSLERTLHHPGVAQRPVGAQPSHEHSGTRPGELAEPRLRGPLVALRGRDGVAALNPRSTHLRRSTMFGKKVVADMISRSAENEHDRRSFLRSAGVAGLGTVGAVALAGANTQSASAIPPAGGPSDSAILNFALNLEYLEAQFYSYAYWGEGLDSSDLTGKGTQGGVTGGRKVRFKTKAIKEYAREIAMDERNHVKFLRAALGGDKVSQPAIDLKTSFTAAARAAGLISSKQTFDPFANENNFLLGAFIFEDVGVTAYKGAAPLITNATYLEAAAGILAVEAYHAGIVRSALYRKGLFTEAKKISDVRDAVDGSSDDDQPIRSSRKHANLVPTDANSIVYSRTAANVLNVVYLTPAKTTKGGFYPNGVNGEINTSNANG